MKKFLFLVLLIACTVLQLFSQIPEKLNYQGVLRNSTGELVKNTSITLKVSLLQGGTSGIVIYSESHTIGTNNYGQFTVQVGSGAVLSGTFNTIDWSQQMYQKTEVANPAGGTFVDMGTVQLLSVPYALYAKNVANKDDADADPTNEFQIISRSNDTIYLSDGGFIKLPVDNIDDADADPTNELQNLTLTGDTLKISNGNHVLFPYDSSQWIINGDKLYYNTGNVGIGSIDPTSKLEVKSNATGALFQVINANNDTVFAVYPDGVKVFVDPDAKGRIGGFAVSGRTPTKLGETVEYFRVTPDSTRIYVNDSITGKGRVGGFAVSGRTPTKGLINDYLFVTSDSTRIYVNDISKTKGRVGGFAVSGRTPTKGVVKPFMDMTKKNYFIGHEAGSKNANGTWNSFLGYQSGFSNYDGSSNVFIGYQSGFTNNDGFDNIFLGHGSGYLNKNGHSNIFIGSQSGYNTDGTPLAGTGSSNIFIGSLAGWGNTTGSKNIFLGDMGGFFNTEGLENVFIGTQPGYSNTTGNYNIILGSYSGYNNKTGNRNIFMGYQAGFQNIEGSNNVFMGESAGRWNINGNINVSIGYLAGYNMTGNNNAILGSNAGFNCDSSNVMLGYSAGKYESGSNKLYISNTETMSPLIYGEFDNDLLKLNATVNIRDFMVLEPQNTAPASPAKGTVYFDNTDNKAKMWDGTTWQSLW